MCTEDQEYIPTPEQIEAGCKEIQAEWKRLDPSWEFGDDRPAPRSESIRLLYLPPPSIQQRKKHASVDIRRRIKEAVDENWGTHAAIGNEFAVSERTVFSISEDCSTELLRHRCYGCGAKVYLPCVYCQSVRYRKENPGCDVADPLPDLSPQAGTALREKIKSMEQEESGEINASWA